MRRTGMIVLIIAAFLLASCSSGNPVQTSAPSADVSITEETEFTTTSEEIIETKDTEMTTMASESIDMENIVLEINGVEIPVTWEDNESVEALKDLSKTGPLTIEMSMYGGFEQVGAIGQDLPRDDEEITTQSGDIVLYSGDQIVLFYGSNTWSYTRLGKMNLSGDELEALLGIEDVSIVISVK